MQEVTNQKATHRIEELERVKQRLEQEVHISRQRLEVESLAARQVSAPWWQELLSPGSQCQGTLPAWSDHSGGGGCHGHSVSSGGGASSRD